MQLQRDSKVPLYQQLKSALRARIESGEWRPGQQIPSEPELCEALGIARGTVRNALADLAREGWLERRQGEGTYVARRHLEQNLMRLYSFGREAQQRGLSFCARILEWSTLRADERLAETLSLAPGEELLRVSRLRLLEDEPILIETCHIPAALAHSLTEEDFVAGALYDVYEERCRVPILRAEETFAVTALTPREASLLDVTPRSPAFQVERVAYTAADRPVELRRSTIRGDRCRYHLELR